MSMATGPMGPAMGGRTYPPSGDDLVGEAEIAPGVSVVVGACVEYGESAPSVTGYVTYRAKNRSHRMKTPWRNALGDPASILSSLLPLPGRPDPQLLADREPRGGWPEEALDLVRRAARRAAAFDLAAQIAVGYADVLGPGGIRDATRLSAVLEVMRS